jgi:hypothetical protein
MCDACEEDDVLVPYVPIDRDRVSRAREIEAGMAGERVPEGAWNIYFGRAGGSIEWRHLLRIRQAYDAAGSETKPPARLGKKAAQRRRVPVCAEIVS